MKKFLKLLFIIIIIALVIFGITKIPKKEKMAKEQEITVCVGPDPATMDPALNSVGYVQTMLTNTFSGLYGYEKDTNGNIVMIPECAKEIVEPLKMDDGKYQYVITLKDNLKWSDGSQLKASDFTYAWKRAADPKLGADYQFIFSPIDGYSSDETCNLNVVANNDDNTITIVTTSYCSYFNQLLAFQLYYPVKEEIVKENVNWSTNADTYITNGPFKMKEWNVGDKIVFEKNENYWDAKNVKLNKLIFALSDDDEAIFANYTNETYSYISSIPVTQLSMLKSDSNRFNKDFFIGDYIGTYFIEFNINTSFKPGIGVASTKETAWEEWTPAKNAEVRYALGLLIDRNYIVNNITQGGEIPADSFIPKGMDDGSGNEFRNRADKWWDVKPENYEKNCEEAVKILKKYYKYTEDEKGNTVFTDFPTFEYSVNTSTSHLALCEAVQDMWKDYGINASVDQRSWTIIQTALTEGDFTMARLALVADYNDPISFLELYTTSSGLNHPQIGKKGKIGLASIYGEESKQTWKESYDKLIEEINRESNTEKRTELLYKAEKMIHEQYILLPIYYYTNPYCANTKLKDFMYSPFGWVSFKNAYVSK